MNSAEVVTITGRERDFFIENLLVRIHFIIVMVRWTGLAPWDVAFSFPGSLTSTGRTCKTLSAIQTNFERPESEYSINLNDQEVNTPCPTAGSIVGTYGGRKYRRNIWGQATL